MLYPKIEDCVKNAGGKYALAIIVFKRSKELTMKRPAEFESSRTKEISYALNEVLAGSIRPTVG